MTSLAKTDAGAAPEASKPSPFLSRLGGLRPGAPSRGVDVALAQQVRAVALRDARGDDPRLAMAVVLAGLWCRYCKHDAADPGWPDRDRVVAVPSAFDPLLDALLDLTREGHYGSDAIRPSQPTILRAEGALGVALGLALAERQLATRFGRSLVDHRTWALVGDGAMSQGLSHEAACLAGQLRLEKLTVLWDHDETTRQAGMQASAHEALRRFVTYGWTVKTVDASDAQAVEAAFGMAMRSKKPTLIACRTVNPVEPVAVAQPLEASAGQAVGTRGVAARRSWIKRMVRHPQRAEFDRVMAGRLPDGIAEAFANLKLSLAVLDGDDPMASGRALPAIMQAVPELVSASALAHALPESALARRHLHFGERAGAMTAAMTGIVEHGGLLAATFGAYASAEAFTPSLRAAARTGARAIAAVFRPEPAQMPDLDLLPGLRSIPNLLVLQPADAFETAECWELALRRLDGPSILVMEPDASPALRSHPGERACARGAYVVAEAEGPRQVTLIAAGAQVAVAMAARALLAMQHLRVAVVSMPCWTLFARTEPSYQAAILGGAPRFGLESGSGFGWERWLGDGLFISPETSGTHETVAARVRQHLAARNQAE